MTFVSQKSVSGASSYNNGVGLPRSPADWSPAPQVLDMLRKIPAEEYGRFWKEYSTNVKLGVMEDPSNRARLAKLLRFYSSRGGDEMVALEEYAARMKPAQKHIYYIAGASRQEVERSPFAERLVRLGYEVLYLTEAVDEYCLSSLPEFDGHKFQNIAKEIFDLEEGECGAALDARPTRDATRRDVT